MRVRGGAVRNVAASAILIVIATAADGQPIGSAEQYWKLGAATEEQIKTARPGGGERKALSSKAIEYYTLVIEHREARKELIQQALRRRAELYLMAGNCEPAIRDATALIAGKTNGDPDPYHLRGECYSMSGEYSNAVADYTEAITLGATTPFIYESRGRARYELGDYKSAIEDFSVFLQAHPVAHVYEARGDAYSLSNMQRLARGDYGKALELKIKLKKELHGKSGQVDDLAGIVELESKIARSYLSERNVRPAIDIYNRMIKEHSRNHEGYLGLAEAYLVGENPKDLKKSIDAASKAVSLSRGTDAHALAALAEGYFRNGDAKQATGVIERAIKLKPDNQQFRDSLEEYRAGLSVR